MAERKSFVVYKDWEEPINLLSHGQAGTLLRAIFDYVERGRPYDGDDPMVKMAFAFVRIVLDRDNEKYQVRCAANARNGQKGGRPRKDASVLTSLPESDDFYD